MMKKAINRLVIELSAWMDSFLKCIPGITGIKVRYLFYRPLFKNCGKKVNILNNVNIRGFKNISLGNNVSFGYYCWLSASGTGKEEIVIGDNLAVNNNVMINADKGGRIEIGSNVRIGPNVVFRASNHRYKKRDKLVREQQHNPGKIIVGDDVWFGANVVILPDVEIGKGAIIAAGAVVTKNVKDYTVVAGVPAKEISMRV